MDIFLWILVAAFWAWEAVAHFVLHNRSGHTLSNRIWAFEKLTGWPGHVLVGASLLALALHLVFNLF